MATQNMKRFGIPAALVVGGVTAGSLFAPIGFAAAQDADTDTEPDASVESDATESGEDGEREGRRNGRRAAKAEVLSEALGLTTEEIRDGFADGNTIADLAEAQGIPADDVEAALVAAANERIDAAVESGRLDEDEAAEKRAAVEERIDELMTTDPSEFKRHGKGHRRAHARGIAGEVVQETLGLTGEEIRAGLQEGKTLSDLAVEQGVSADDLAAAMIAAAEERIDAAVEEGKVDADRAAEKLADLEERIDDILNGELPERDGHGRRGGFRGDRGLRGEAPADAPSDDVEDAGLSA
ncbi:MAG: hypothetical protein AAF531_21515 [Actinomycetota bacterium]